MEWREKLLHEVFDGDVEKWEDDYSASIEEGRSRLIQWEDLARASAVLPELETEGRNLIEQRLGYLPHDCLVVPQEAFIRAIIQNHRQGQLTDIEFYRQADEHIKLIRNADLKHNTCLFYDPAIYRNYHQSFVPYGYMVKSRLTEFLGYEPHLEHSVVAEMWLRDLVADDQVQLPNYPTEADYRAMTLIKYREVLLEKGKEVVDASPLFAWCKSAF